MRALAARPLEGHHLAHARRDRAAVIVVPALSGWPAVGDWVRVTRKMVVGGRYARLGLAPDGRVSTFAVDERP